MCQNPDPFTSMPKEAREEYESALLDYVLKGLEEGKTPDQIVEDLHKELQGEQTETEGE